MNIVGQYFDGKSSASKEAIVYMGLDNKLRLTIDGKIFSYKESDYKLIPSVGNTPLRIQFNDGALLELPSEFENIAGFKRNINIIDRSIGLAERRWRLSIASVFGAIMICAVIYLYILPWAAKGLAPLVPMSVKNNFGDQAWNILDKYLFDKSSLSMKRKYEVENVFAELIIKDPRYSNFEFFIRSMKDNKREIPNAFALLPKRIIVTEGLINILTNQELEAVIAHEIGHLHHDHGTQILVRSSAISLISLSMFGGDPGVIHSLAVTFAESQYSQDNEYEADAFAVEYLKKNGKDPLAHERALNKLASLVKESKLEGYFSSHPLTSERIKKVRELAQK